MPTAYAFIDAANLFYGGEKSLGWKIDYQKLLQYLQKKYAVEVAYYFGGVETHQFNYDYLQQTTVPINALEYYLAQLILNHARYLSAGTRLLLGRHLQQVRFYRKLKKFGYQLRLKPVKLYEQEDGTRKRKANCDVDMAFYLMREQHRFQRVIILSGDGDFLPILKYLKEHGKEVIILARGSRTAKEIKQFASGNFRDFEYLKYLLKME